MTTYDTTAPASRCEDYPCCGHTSADPCSPQWYDAPDAFDTLRNPHALCDHENGDCEVDYDEPDDTADEDEDIPWEREGGEDRHLDGMYEE